MQEQEYTRSSVTTELPKDYNKKLTESAKRSGRTKRAEATCRLHASLDLHHSVVGNGIVVDQSGNKHEI